MTNQQTQPLVHFLIVDDLKENLVALEALLRRPGLSILSASSGAEALEQLLKHDVALAIVDVQMPGMSGFELAELMRGTERTRRVPIIFVTAGVADRQRRFRGYEAGAVDFLGKPIEPDILRSKAEVFYDLYRERQEVAQQRDNLKAANEKIQVLLRESKAQAQALREADQRKDEFLATLAHELRNPLAPIRNAIEILRLHNDKSPTVLDAVEIATRQVSHMSRLIDDLLDIARIAKGKVELRLELCDVIEIVRNVTEDYRATLANNGIELVVQCTTDRLRVMGDAVRIAQMVGNLLHNAAKFTPEHGRVSVQVCKEDESNQAIVRVVDSGVGFKMSESLRFFEPFGQAAHGDHKGGLGLGLALTKGLVQLHQGQISGESGGHNLGATFTLRIPIANSTANVNLVSAATPQAAPGNFSILIVEDNVDSGRSLQLLLSLLGHKVQLATDGESALATAKEMRPDIVISDLALPGNINGFEIAKALRSDASFKDIYLVALSGFGRPEDQQRTREAGFDQHLVKPVELNGLKKVIQKVYANNRN